MFFRSCVNKTYDQMMMTKIVEMSKEQVGCIAPFIREEHSQGLEVCEDDKLAKKAGKIYQDIIYDNTLV